MSGVARRGSARIPAGNAVIYARAFRAASPAAKSSTQETVGANSNAGDDAAGCIPQAPKKIIKELPSRSVKGPSFKIPSPHDLGLHHVLKPLRPLVNPLVDTLAKRRLEKAVNIADLRMCAKKRAHKMVTCVLRAHTRCFAFRAHTVNTRVLPRTVAKLVMAVCGSANKTA